MNVCPGPADAAGAVRGVLGSVDCQVEGYARAAYLALTGPDSFLPAALTSLLVIYVALIGFRLMLGIGQVRLADAPMIALKIGVILALTFNWALFETLVFDVATRAPLEVAAVIGKPLSSGGSSLAADPLDGLEALYTEIGLDAELLGHRAGPNPVLLQGGEALASQKLWSAQAALFLSTAGILAMALIAVGILTALGPLFIALALINETAGLFWGWLRALVGVALVPMLCWTTTLILLATAEPWAADLAQARTGGQIRLATVDTLSLIVFVFAAAQAALTAASLAIAGGLVAPRRRGGDRWRESGGPVRPDAAIAVSRADRLALTLGDTAVRRSANAPATLAIDRVQTGSMGTIGGTTGPGPTPATLHAGDTLRRNAHLRSGSTTQARRERPRR